MANRTVLPLVGDRSASSPRTRAAPRRPWRRSARRARAGPGSATRASAARTRCVCPPDNFCVRRSATSPIPVRAITSSTDIGCGYSEAIIATSSRTDRSRISEPVCSMAPIRPASDRLLAASGRTAGPSRVGVLQAEHHVDGRGLAGAVRAEHGDRLPGRDVEAHTVDGADGTLRRPVGLDQVLEADPSVVRARGAGGVAVVRHRVRGRVMPGRIPGVAGAPAVSPAVRSRMTFVSAGAAMLPR